MASLESLLHEVRRIEEHRVELTEKKIKSIYRSLDKDLSAFIAEEYVKYADKDGKLFLSYLDSKGKRAKFLSQIVKDVDGISADVKQHLMDLVDATYEKTYEGIAKAVKEADDTKELLSGTDTLVRPEVLKQAVNNNIEKLTLDAVMEKHRAEIVADIQQTLTVGLMTGDRYETMAKRIQERLGVSYSKASNIARTESHRNIENGFMDGAKETAKIIEQDGDLIYAATWRTMKDDRVRPQQMRKTKKGWVKTMSGNGANHMKMEGVTIKVGEKFKLEPNVYAECPGMSGTARNDCRCRCFLQYSLMTVAEFAKATNQTEEAVRKKYDMPVAEEEKSENLDEVYAEYQELIHKYGDKDGLLIMGSGEEIEQYAIMKKKLANYTPKTTKATSTNTQLPKSLENFDEYQQKWVDSHFLMRKKDKEILQEGIQEVINNNAYSMRVNARDMQSIIDKGFLNQFQTKTSGGTLSARDRKTASYRLFGNDAMKMADDEFEKYGYLGSMDFKVDAKTSQTSQYGRTIVKFKKDELKDRVTYTVDDSLGNALYNEVVGGKIGDECSISGVPLFNTDDLLEYFKESDWADIDNADEIAQLMGCRYWEIQFHGKLTIDDVDSICYTGRDNPTDEILKQLKDHNVKVYKLASNKLKEL